jgi:hypothetical protein
MKQLGSRHETLIKIDLIKKKAPWRRFSLHVLSRLLGRKAQSHSASAEVLVKLCVEHFDVAAT